MKLVHDASTVTPRDKFLTLQEVCSLCSVKKSTIYAWINDPDSNFPRPVHLSVRMVRWPETAILTWIQSTMAKGTLVTEMAPTSIEGQQHTKPTLAYAKSNLRDQFAIAALQGLLANPQVQKEILARGQSWVSTSAWAWADDMMKLRTT